MWKKIGATLLLSTTLMVGGVFSTSADAAVKGKQQSFQIYSHVYDSVKNISWNHLNNYLNQFMKNLGQLDWQSEKQPKHEQSEGEQTQEEVVELEQPKTEQPNQEKPKQDKPVIEQQEQSQPEVQQPTEQAPQQEEQTQAQIGQLSQFEQEVVSLTNAERSKNGLAPLQADSELSRVAREKSNNMAQVGYFAHNSPTYGSPFDMMQAYGINYRTAGENIAKGQGTPQEVVNAWMNSPGHRENIMNGNFTHIGVGYVEQGNHWTQMFTGK